VLCKRPPSGPGYCISGEYSVMTVYVTAEVEVPVESDKRCATPNPATLASAGKIPRALVVS